MALDEGYILDYITIHPLKPLHLCSPSPNPRSLLSRPPCLTGNPDSVLNAQPSHVVQRMRRVCNLEPGTVWWAVGCGLWTDAHRKIVEREA